MENAIINRSDSGNFTPDQIALIKNNICKGATDDEFKLFLYQCVRTGLDPFSRQIYFQKRLNRKTGKYDMIVITGIDGYRAIAIRTGKCAGIDDPIFDQEDEPNKATVAVYRMVEGIKAAFTASARWAEYYPGEALGYIWKKMPCNQLGKCAEALALRKAFPADLSGVYVKEELDQAGKDGVIESQIIEEKKEDESKEWETSKQPKITKQVFNPDLEHHISAMIGVLNKKGILDNQEQREIMNKMIGLHASDLDKILKEHNEQKLDELEKEIAEDEKKQNPNQKAVDEVLEAIENKLKKKPEISFDEFSKTMASD